MSAAEEKELSPPAESGPAPTVGEMRADSPSSGTLVEKNDVEEAAAASAAYPKHGREAPDGGAEAWLVVFGAWCTAFCSFGWINSIGTFQEYYQATLLSSYSASQISWIPSLQIFFIFALGPIIGKTYDSYGPRYLLLGGTFLHVFGLMMASIATEYYQILLSQGVCSAIGVAMVFQPAISCVGGWFIRNRGGAYGILATGSSIGGVIFPIMVSRLIRQIGYGWAMRTAAFFILFLLILANVTIKSLNPPNPQKITKEQLRKPFTEPAMVGVTLGVALITFGIFIPITFLVVQATAAGMSPDLAQYLLAILNAASLFGRAFSGFLADKIGCFNVFIIVCYVTGILILGLWIPANTNSVIICFAAFFGFFSGAYVSLGPALVARISLIKEIGFRTGLLFLVSSVGGLTAGPIAGAILARDNGDFLGTKIFAGVFTLVGTTLVLVTRIHAVGVDPRAKF